MQMNLSAYRQPRSINYSTKYTSLSNKFVIRQPVTFRNEEMYNAHRFLRAVDKNIVISKQQPEDIAGTMKISCNRRNCSKNSVSIPHRYQYPAADGQVLDEMEFGIDKTKKIYSSSKKMTGYFSKNLRSKACVHAMDQKIKRQKKE